MISNEPNMASSDKLVVYAASAIFAVYERLRAIPPAEIMQVVCYAVGSRYSRGLDRQSLGLALTVLIKGTDGQKYIQAVVDSYHANMPGVTEHTLVAAAAQDAGEIIMPVFAAALARGGHPKQRTLRALAYAPDLRVRELGDRIVRYYLSNGIGAVDYDVSRYAEARIWNGDLGEDVLDVIQRVIDAPAASGRYVLAYPLSDFDQPGDSVQRLALLRKLIKSSTDSKSASRTAEVLIKRISENKPLPEVFELMQQVLAYLEGSEADRILIVGAFGSRDFADCLAGWLAAGKLPPPGDHTRQFKKRIESGESPAMAAEEVVHQVARNRNN
jgi:hypothetical protein